MEEIYMTDVVTSEQTPEEVAALLKQKQDELAEIKAKAKEMKIRKKSQRQEAAEKRNEELAQDATIVADILKAIYVWKRLNKTKKVSYGIRKVIAGLLAQEPQEQPQLPEPEDEELAEEPADEQDEDGEDDA